MGFPRRLNGKDQERLLAGAPLEGHGEFDEVAAFMRALPEQVPESPPEGLERTLVPRLAEAARTSVALAETPPPTPIQGRRPLSRLALAARVAVAVALIPALMAGLAVAGVNVPTPAQDAFEGIGVELPNQDGNGDDDSTPVTEPPGSDRAEDAGTEEGKGKKLGHEKSPAKGGTPPGRKLGHEKSPAKGGTPPSQADGQGNSGSSRGNSGGGGGSSSGGNSDSSQGKSSSAPGQTKTKPVRPVRAKQ